jgi:hypothetical protein
VLRRVACGRSVIHQSPESEQEPERTLLIQPFQINETEREREKERERERERERED